MNSLDMNPDRKRELGLEIKIEKKNPGELSKEEINRIVALIEAGGEISSEGLEDAVRNCEFIILARNDSKIVGTFALKNPSQERKKQIFTEAGIVDKVNDFKYEAGFFTIDKDKRNSGLAGQIVEEMKRNAPQENVYIVVRKGNKIAEGIAKGSGFKVVKELETKGPNNSTRVLMVKEQLKEKI